MISITTNKGRTVITLKGKFEELMNDLSTAIEVFYDSFDDDYHKDIIKHWFTDPDGFAKTVFDTEEEKPRKDDDEKDSLESLFKKFKEAL